jgi:hypothetical protein
MSLVLLKNDEVISGYNIKKHDSGIIELNITTHHKWVEYFRSDDQNYFIGGMSDKWAQSALTIPEINIPKYYICTELQDKDNIYFYWIPFELITSGRIKDKVLKYRNGDKTN